MQFQLCKMRPNWTNCHIQGSKKKKKKDSAVIQMTWSQIKLHKRESLCPPLCVSWQLSWGCWIIEQFPDTPTTLLFLSARLYLNINFPQCQSVSIIFRRWDQSVMFCGTSATFYWHFRTVWSLNSIPGWPFFLFLLFCKTYNKEKLQ